MVLPILDPVIILSKSLLPDYLSVSLWEVLVMEMCQECTMILPCDQSSAWPVHNLETYYFAQK